MHYQQNLFFNYQKPERNPSTFQNNMKQPIHRWFRFSAGFSSQWVQQVILKEREAKRKEICLLDPFVGSGTSLLSADENKTPSYGIEAQPFIGKIAKIKTDWNVDLKAFSRLTEQVLLKAKNYKKISDEYPKLIYKCYSEDVLLKLEGLKKAWKSLDDGSKESNLVWLCLTCILRLTSQVGTAQWQYVLPNKSKKRIVEVFEGFDAQAKMISEDIHLYQTHIKEPLSKLILGSCIDSLEVPSQSIDLVITSPPYANNYDYADATRLELSFWNEIKGWSDLHNKIRKNLLRACSQHAASVKENLDEILNDPNLEPIIDELSAVTKRLEIERENYGGKKPYHLMVAGYFSDMAKVWHNLRRMCKPDSTVCFVVGDSAPYSIYVPVEKWIGKIAISSGFDSYKFEKIRDRNIKWKNRKHRVPLKEGNLWIKG